MNVVCNSDQHLCTSENGTKFLRKFHSLYPGQPIPLSECQSLCETPMQSHFCGFCESSQDICANVNLTLENCQSICVLANGEKLTNLTKEECENFHSCTSPCGPQVLLSRLLAGKLIRVSSVEAGHYYQPIKLVCVS